MPDERDDEISKLLRLKRYEQPPPEYFENFLHEFHRRQRAELLRQPLWRIAWERVSAFFSEETASRWAYGAATALVLLTATIISVNIVNSPRNNEPQFAGADPTNPPTMEKLSPPPSTQLRLASQPQFQLPDLHEFSKHTAQSSSAASLRPRYVMDARPVSYEPESSF